MGCYLVVPALKISGGIREVLRLGDELENRGISSIVVCMWGTPHPMNTGLRVHRLSDHVTSIVRVLFEMPLLLFRFSRWMRTQIHVSPANSRPCFVFTHYVTLPLSLLVPTERRFFFVQDTEWKFVKNPLLSFVLRKAVLYFYRRGKLISANAYLTKIFQDLQIPVALEAPIWADEAFLADENGERDIDFVMILRKGHYKRLDLYLSFIEMANRNAGIRIGVISPEEHIIAAVQDRVVVSLLRPSMADMRKLYMRSRCFLHLSDHEGFGLPPLEAMGAGCVPLCRDSGGVRAFMTSNEMSPLLLSSDMSLGDIFRRAQILLAQPDQLEALARVSRNIFQIGLLNVKDRGIELERTLG